MKKSLIIACALAVFVSAIVFVTLTKDKSESAVNNTPTSSAPTATTKAPETQKGQYITYSEEIIAKTSGTKLLFFHAPWCPQCRAIEAGISEETIPDGVTVIKVDYDSNQALRQEYGVTLQTTFVKVDDEGNLVKKYVAYDEPTFASVKENLL